MTVNSIGVTSGPYAGNDIADTFSYTFKVAEESQLAVFETDDVGVQTLLVLTTDYVVNSVGDPGGGTITRVAGPLPTDYTWFIRSDYELTQLTSFESQGAFFPELHEDAMDKLTYLIQQVQDIHDRSIRMNIATAIDGDLTFDEDAAQRADKIIGFDGDGDVILFSFTEGGNPFYVLKSGDTMTGDLLMVGGDIESDSSVTCVDVTVGAGGSGSQVRRASETDTLLALKAPLASPALTGVPTAPTAPFDTNTTQLATTEFAHARGFGIVQTGSNANGRYRLYADGFLEMWTTDGDGNVSPGTWNYPLAMDPAQIAFADFQISTGNATTLVTATIDFDTITASSYQFRRSSGTQVYLSIKGFIAP